MNTTDRRMTKALMGFRRKQTGGFSLSELSCLVLSGLAGRKGPDNDAAMRIKGRKNPAAEHGDAIKMQRAAETLALLSALKADSDREAALLLEYPGQVTVRLEARA